ncbi:MAG: growth inhibitor PemK [Alphaproteobacteria bacterium]|nr:growth inhibitor PemK [Alphaproteobacteria bacterium]
MPLPDPRPGLIFRYEYVWKRQALAGQSVGEKERPACVVLAVTGDTGDQRALIVPITTRPPPANVHAIEIPSAVKRHLGLDADHPSWIILDEANIDCWPSPDMRPIPGKPGRYAYGMLPLGLVNRIRDVILPALAEKRLDLVKRD